MATAWYKNAVIYQIYPRSFADSNCDGVGDLAGITSKLDYLQDLQVDAIWLSPIYRSPMADFGYDVSDYQMVDPVFGNLDDFDQLIAAAHRRGIKVLMDLIPNHTSDQHPWFLEAKASPDSPKRHWYIWKDAKTDGTPPNNWQSVFGGPAWTYDSATAQYYMHSFLKEQPDLNWANPEVHEAIQNVMRFWYRRGVDGFRVDAILFTSKDLEFRDNPDPQDVSDDVLGNEFEKAFSHGVGENLPHYIKVLTDVSQEFPDRCVLLEAHPDKGDPAGYAKIYDFIDHNIAAPFYFAMFTITYDWQASTFAQIVDGFQSILPSDAFAAYVLGNHDITRLATRSGQAVARAAAVALLTLPGAKIIYYGDELGMEDAVIPPERAVDPSNVPRDPERTPMRWTPQEYAGFSSVEPWLPLGSDVAERNVETMLADKQSILQLYKQLITLYKSQPTLQTGAFQPLNLPHSVVYGFKRVTASEELLILINFSDQPAQVAVADANGELLFSSSLNYEDRRGSLQHVHLSPNEAVIIRVDPVLERTYN